METREIYEAAILEIVSFENEDIVTASPPADDNEGKRYDL